MLLAVFGDAAVLPQVAAAHANAQQHLCRLSALAHLVVELGMSEVPPALLTLARLDT